MNKDLHPKENKDVIHALNTVIENDNGDIGILQNEASNLLSITLREDQRILNSLFIPSQNKTLLFTTNSNGSDEILEFFSINYNDNVINYSLEEITQTPLITPRSVIKTNFNWNVKNNFQVEYKLTDCTLNIYFVDGENPDRFIYFDIINNELRLTDDFKKTNSLGELIDVIDVDKTKHNQNIDAPIIKTKEIIGGELKEGVYQVFAAYSTSKGIPLSSYLSNSNLFPIFDKIEKTGEGIEYKTNKGIQIEISNISVNSFYKFINVIVSETINNITSFKSIATLPVNKTVSYIYTGNEDYITKSITDVIQKYPYYKSSELITSANNYLIKGNLKEFSKLNIQRIANKVKLECITKKVSEDFYKHPENVQTSLNYCGDEVYALGIELVFDNGEISAIGHISSRNALTEELLDIETQDAVNGKKQWQVYNTAKLIDSPHTDEVWEVFDFAYWQSTELYPNNPEIWGELSNKNIKHHKFPDSTIAHIHDGKETIVNGSYFKNTNLFIKGIRLKRELNVILEESYNEGLITKEQKDRIKGYRIVRANRAGEKSIIAKGLLYDMWNYKASEDFDDVCSDDTKIYYPNYPFNSLEYDVLLSRNAGHYKYENFEKGQQYPNFQTFNNERKYTFHSPDTHFLTPSIGDVLKIETVEYGESQGYFNEAKKQAQYKLLSLKHYNVAILIATFIANNTSVNSENSASVGTSIGTSAGSILGSAIPGVGTAIGGLVGGLIGGLTDSNDNVGEQLQRNAIILHQTEKILQIFKNLADYQKLQYQYQAIGKYNNYTLPSKGNIQRKIIKNGYLNSGKKTIDGLFINNQDRESSLFLEIQEEIPNISYVKDNSRFKINSTEKTTTYTSCKKFKVIAGDLAIIYARISYINCDGVATNKTFTINDEFYATGVNETDLVQEIACPECVTITSVVEEECNCKSSLVNSNVSSYYGSIKSEKLNQYGNVLNINYIDVDGNFKPINEIGVYFGGDTYVTPFALKRKHSFFKNTTFNLPDDTDIFYEDLPNVAYPTYYFNTKQTDKDFQPNIGLIYSLSSIGDLGLPEYSFWNSIGSLFGGESNDKFNKFKTLVDNFSSSALNPSLWIKSPSYYLDCGNGNNTAAKKLFNFNFQAIKGIIYLYYYGIPYFYCESEINTHFRTSKNSTNSDFYPHQSDLNFWLQEENVSPKEDNYYGYDSTYNKQNKAGFHFVNDINFKPLDCKVNHDNRVVYSLQSSDLDDSDLRDNYLINKALDYKDFSFVDGKLINIAAIENDKVLVGFENNTKIFNAYSTIKTSEGEAVIGNGGIFQNKPQEFSKNKLGYIGNSTDVYSCEFGHLIIDAIRADIFLVKPNGEGVENISEKGMNSWFKQNLIFTINKYFKNVNVRNSHNEIGITVGYDKRNKRFLVTKLDYEPKYKEITYNETLNKFFYLTTEIKLSDLRYFYNKSWTISYNFLTSSWISFHSYLPYKYINNIDYFLTCNKQNLWGHGLTKNSYQVFNGKLFPFELNVQDEYSELYKQLNNISFVTESNTFTEENVCYNNETFNKAIIYNNFQSTGLLELVKLNKNDNYGLSKLPFLTGFSTKIKLTLKENIFNFNQFRNILKKFPIFINEKNNVISHLELNNHNNSFIDNNHSSIMSNVNFIKLIKDDDSKNKLRFKLNSFNKTNSIR